MFSPPSMVGKEAVMPIFSRKEMQTKQVGRIATSEYDNGSQEKDCPAFYALRTEYGRPGTTGPTGRKGAVDYLHPTCINYNTDQRQGAGVVQQ